MNVASIAGRWLSVQSLVKLQLDKGVHIYDQL